MIVEDLTSALRGRTTVFSVTHRSEVAARADRVQYLQGGRIGGRTRGADEILHRLPDSLASLITAAVDAAELSRAQVDMDLE